MRKSTTKIVGDIEIQLSKISNIVNLLEKKSSASTKTLKNWLSETEELLQKLSIPESSMFAVKRGELSTFIPQDTRNKRKELYYFSANLLTGAQENIWSVYQKHKEKLDNATQLIHQLLQIIYQSNQFKYDANEDFTLFIHQVWEFCCAHEQLKPLTLQILTLINKTDVLLVLAKEIEIENL
ncbi:hypothetical protein EV195_10456 [Tenacibaculum skagerrakense]|uniref:Uncharacterized protein n=1 Tax=Tenacibaculum skagerrakense TaxID=186571 RepID=A0A4R2NUH4_9FLAO|nr:hypothetical protein [Tenacibaculum skagerrakense]TCP25025.1 hypothetical protein EV195_10456 [Tenacibaculum skagerrakense]